MVSKAPFFGGGKRGEFFSGREISPKGGDIWGGDTFLWVRHMGEIIIVVFRVTFPPLKKVF